MKQARPNTFPGVAAAVLCLIGGAVFGCGRQGQPASQPLPDAETQRLVVEGQRAMQRQAYLTGLALADSAARRSPGLPDASFLKGRLLYELGRLEEASTAFEQALALDPAYPGVWHNLGNVAFRERRYREALRRYRREQTRDPAPLPWHGMGGAFEALGVADSARWAYEQALALDDAYAPAYASLADWYEREGDFEQALASAQRALTLVPDDLDYHYRVGALLVRTGKPEAAVARLRPVVAARPWDYSALFSLGQALQRTGRQEEAKDVLMRADSVRASQSLVERLEREARNQPEDFARQVDLADALRQSGRLREALAAYHVALSLRPGNLALRNNVATLYMQRNDTAEALARYRGILRDDSTFARAWLNLGLHYARTGRRSSAEAAWRTARRFGKDDPAVQAFFERLGDRP